MFGEGNGELGGHPPHLLAPGDVGCGRENSLPLGGGRKWCQGPARCQSKQEVQERCWGDGVFGMPGPEFLELGGWCSQGLDVLVSVGGLASAP